MNKKKQAKDLKKTSNGPKATSKKFWKQSLKTNHLPLDERIDRLFSELEQKPKKIPWFLIVIASLIVAIMAFCLYLFFQYNLTSVTTNSMDTAISKNSKVLYQDDLRISRFNQVLVERDGKQDILRVIGMPGDSLSFTDDMVTINNMQYDEVYLKRNYIMFKSENNDSTVNYTENFDLSVISKSNEENQHVPQEKYVLLGDNRQQAIDSRKLGYYDEEEIKGTVLFTIWPPAEFGAIE